MGEDAAGDAPCLLELFDGRWSVASAGVSRPQRTLLHRDQIH